MSPSTLAWGFLFLALLTFSVLPGCTGQPNTEDRGEVVLYCALDREFAEEILAGFTEKTGIKVLPRFDTEANKSVALYQEIVRESQRPRCDVYWNNEILATIRLQNQGLLEPYDCANGKSIPAEFKASDQSWYGFAARARILIVNTDLVPREKRPTSLWDLNLPYWKNKIAMAKPQFGTTATQASCLFSALGKSKSEDFYQALKTNGVKIVAGNKQVAEGVGQGWYAVGLTDTDDAMGEIRAGRPVAIIFPDQQRDQMGTLVLPNTLALIKNARNLEAGKKLVDYLLDPEIEKKLSRSASAQIPIHQGVVGELPPEVLPIVEGRWLKVDFKDAAGQWNHAQSFLKNLFAL